MYLKEQSFKRYNLTLILQYVYINICGILVDIYQLFIQTVKSCVNSPS